MRIEKVVEIKGLTLLIYYTSAECWQFVVVGQDGRLWQPDDIFYTPDAAERVGKKWIKAVLG